MAYSMHEKGCLTWEVGAPPENQEHPLSGSPRRYNAQDAHRPPFTPSLLRRMVQGNYSLLAGQHQALLLRTLLSLYSTGQVQGDVIPPGQVQVPQGQDLLKQLRWPRHQDPERQASYRSP